jgi:hypothetical protein
MRSIYCSECGCHLGDVKNGSRLRKDMKLLCGSCYRILKIKALAQEESVSCALEAILKGLTVDGHQR